MKKIIALLAVVMMFTACDSDDDVNDGEDPILGTWFVVDLENAYSDDELSECNMNSNITFHADNTADSEFYEEVQGECVFEAETAGWERNTNGQYTFELPFFGRQTGDVEFMGSNQFKFSVPAMPGVSITFEK
ncbi:MAG TPA: lipocalin family protein [Salegentibacter sp.]|uniref:lipocalin family protein n=1 Tax=Salegentibacter sp. TaxID=1903072 RepID=UPI002F949F7C